MIQQKKTKFFSKVELCEFFDCTGTYFDTNLKPFIPEKACDKNGRLHYYHGRTAVEIFCARRRQASHKVGNVDSAVGIDPLADSPMLERLRKEQFLIARMRRRYLKQELMPTKKVKESLSKLQGIFRALGEHLKISDDPRSLEFLNEAIDKYGREVEALWAKAWDKKSVR